MRSLFRKRRRRLATVRRSLGAGALALAVVAPAVACTNPAYGLDMDADGRHARLTGWLEEDEAGAHGRPWFRITVDGKEISRGRADGERRDSWKPFGHRGERRFNHRFGLTPGPHEICVLPGKTKPGRTAEGATEDEADAAKPRWCRTITVPDRGDKGRPAKPTTPPTTGGPEAPPTTAPPAPPTTAPPTTAPPTTAAPTPPPTEPPAPAPTEPPPPAPAPGWQGEMLAAVNAARAENGKPPVAPCGNLDRAAQGYADVMAANGWFDHTGPDGSTLTSRTNASGYVGEALGENIASGYPDVPAVMRGWLDSPGHRDIVLGDYAHIGVGRTAENVWVQDYGSGGTC